eukprot:gene55648-6933_t
MSDSTCGGVSGNIEINHMVKDQYTMTPGMNCTGHGLKGGHLGSKIGFKAALE